VEQVGEWCGLAMDGDRSEGEFEFETEFADGRCRWLGKEFDHSRRLPQDGLHGGAGAMVAESGQGEATTAAELGLAQVAAIKGIEDLAPLFGSAVAGHPQSSPGLRKAVDGLGRALTVEGRRGQGDWEEIGILGRRALRDTRPLAVRGQPEVREYRARFFDGSDHLSGDWSPVETVTVSP
jgi:hypothetical protein